MTTMTDRARRDAQLVEAYARGDQGALETLVERRYDEAYRYCLRVLRDPARADDAAQDAFVALIRGARRFQPGRAFGPWWGGILANTVRDAGRSEQRRQRREQTVARRAPASRAAPDAEAERGEIEAQVQALPDDLRAPLTLHFYQGLTHREVARSLGCPPGTASSRIRRGLERLRGQLVAAGHAGLVPQLEQLLSEPSSAAPTAHPSVRRLQAVAARVSAAALLLKAGVVVCLALVIGLGWAGLTRGSREAPRAASPPSGVAPAVDAAGAGAVGGDRPAELAAAAATLVTAGAPLAGGDPPSSTPGSASASATLRSPEPAFDPAREALLRIRCLDDQGHAVPGVRLELVPVDAADRPQGEARVLELRDGHLAVALPAGGYRYTVDAGEAFGSELEQEPGGAARLDLVPGERRRLQVDLLRMVVVRVAAVEVPAGSRRQLEVAVESERRAFYVNAPVGGDQVQVVHAWPGDVQVTILDPQRGVFGHDRFRAEPGEQRDCLLRLDQAAPCRLTGVVVGGGDRLPLPGAEVDVWSGDQPATTTWTRDDGSFEVWTLQPVTNARVSAAGCLPVELQVEDPARRLVVELEREGVVELELVTPAGHLADGFVIDAHWTRADGAEHWAGSRTDSRGIYEASLVEGTYRVEIEGVAGTQEVVVRPGETVRLRARLLQEPR